MCDEGGGSVVQYTKQSGEAHLKSRNFRPNSRLHVILGSTWYDFQAARPSLNSQSTPVLSTSKNKRVVCPACIRRVSCVLLIQKIWRELKISLRKSETKALVAWFDRSTANRLHYADLCDAIFGRSSAGPDALYSSRKQEERRPLQQAPPRPHVLQAQRSAALALGESSSSSNSSVAYATPLRTSMQELKRLAAEKDDRLASKTAWNWQGHPPAAGDRNPEFGEGYRKKSSEPGSGDPPGSGVAPVRFRGVLKASGEAIVAEKARIEKRLKEVQRERALLLREKKRVECWRDTTTGRGRTTSSTPDAPANKCGA